MKNEKELKDEIIDYLETEYIFNPAVLIEIGEIENMDYEELLKKAKELGICI